MSAKHIYFLNSPVVTAASQSNETFLMVPVDLIIKLYSAQNHNIRKNKPNKKSDVKDFLIKDPTQANFSCSFVNNFNPCLVRDIAF